VRTMRYRECTYQSEDGLRLFYRDYAGPDVSARTVLCLPGLTRNSQDFEVLAEHLQAHFRVLCADLRGRGKSDYAPDAHSYNLRMYAGDIVRLLDSADVAEAVFVGTSLGGLVTTMTLAMHQSLVRAAIINDIGPVIESSGLERIASYVNSVDGFASWQDAAAAMREQNSMAFPSFDDADWLRMARRLCVEQPDGSVRPDFDKHIAVPMREAGPAPTTDLWPLFEAYAGIPTLCIRGALSDILSAQTFREMKSRISRLQQALVPGVGHAPLLTEPQALAAIDSFLAVS